MWQDPDYKFTPINKPLKSGAISSIQAKDQQHEEPSYEQWREKSEYWKAKFEQKEMELKQKEMELKQEKQEKEDLVSFINPRGI
jgi:hypothetical protein